MAPHLLIIRFSSFGDIIHGIGVPMAFKERFPDARVDWIVRSDLKGLVENHPAIDRVIAFDRREGWRGLLRQAWRLAKSDYTHVYDAHSNVRSFFVRLVFLLAGSKASVVVRSKERFQRWRLFRFKKSSMPKPYRSADSFHRPLAKWGLAPVVPSGPQYFPRTSLPNDVESALLSLPKPYVALAPSAAWEMKRWPIEHWISLMNGLPHASFLLLGGPEDEFLTELALAVPGRTLNLAGRLSLVQSATLLHSCALTIANDTGMMHVADQMERPTIALIGPTAFGYPSHSKSRALEIELWCKPCSKDGRGRCVNDLYKRCLVDLRPERVIAVAREVLG
ncbi:MAG: glycosyltransferase family 9 protein [Bdellovibrionota bacterium]